MAYTLDSPRESTMHKLLLTLVVFSSGVLCNAEQNLTDTVNWIVDPTHIMNRDASDATADSVPSSVSMSGQFNYHAAQQVFFVNGLPDIYRKAMKDCSMHLRRFDYVETAGMGAHKLHTNSMNWNQARKTCMTEGGTLAIINSAEEEKMLLNWMQRENVYLTWLGVHDLFEEGDWVTLTGETLEEAGYNVWEKNEPNNELNNENCGILVNEGGMNDIPCDRMLPFFCKINLC
ncbi:hemolymph lipopolysaccharide-binding protein-like [Andrena cerasifolii]|uniref:hemolymph lipopolysaccharide-binding protein-like n=1 Tax=Andrena cerasifolii TaxID=2819439 RepID=UPI004037E68C